MQLRTILISTGILALATSLTLGGPTPAILATGPGKRTDSNTYYAPLRLVTAQATRWATLEPGDWWAVTGIYRQNSGRQTNIVGGDITLCCEMPSRGCVFYDPVDNQFDIDGWEHALSKYIVIGEGHIFNWTVPYINPPDFDGTGSVPGHYDCTFKMKVHGKHIDTTPAVSQDVYIDVKSA